MRAGRQRLVIGRVLVAAALVGGCAAQTITNSLPKPVAVPGEPNVVAGTPAEVYGRIASGSLACWFAVNGQLKKTHIFHADADPPAKGGAVEIAVHERDKEAPRPWGFKAFKVALTAAGSQTAVEVANIKMPEESAQLMRADVFAWAQGETTCRLKPVEVVEAAPEPAKKAVKVKSKVKTKPAPQ